MVKWVCWLSFRSQRQRTALLRAFEVWAKNFQNLEKVRLGSRHGPLKQEISHFFSVFVVGKKHKKMKCLLFFVFVVEKKHTKIKSLLFLFSEIVAQAFLLLHYFSQIKSNLKEFFQWELQIKPGTNAIWWWNLEIRHV